MNSPSVSLPKHLDAGAQPDFQQQLETWRQLLAQCGRKPSRRRAHALRVVTLRLESELEFWLRSQDSAAPPARLAQRWCELGNKLRRALGPVRETDVFLAKLASLRDNASRTKTGSQPAPTRSCLRQIASLERRLARKRQTAARKLVVKIEDRRKRLDHSTEELETVLASSISQSRALYVTAIYDLFASLAAEFPTLDEHNLHAFRKRTKQLRYLAEVSALADPKAKQQAAALTKMQTAAGEWRDWQVLAKEAQRVLHGHGKAKDLHPLLETQANKSLSQALALCRRSTAQLLKSSQSHTLNRSS